MSILFLVSWQSSGTLQGKMVAICEGDSVAVICCDDRSNLMHGVAYHEASKSMQALVESIDQMQIVSNFGSLQPLYLLMLRPMPRQRSLNQSKRF